MNIIVSDSGPIIHLHEADLIYLLNNAGMVYIPERVLKEVESNLSIKLSTTTLNFDTIILNKNEIIEKQKYMHLHSLHEGEAEAIVLAQRMKADWLLTDDTSARVFASLLDLEVHGTLGIVLWNVANNYIHPEEGKDFLNQLRNTSLWLSEKVFRFAWDSIEQFKLERES